MPLIDLKTNLKSLKYGQDRPGGGSSRQPYIQTDINRPGDNLIGNLDDGLVRGGALGAAKASLVDTGRIGKFLTDLPKGPLFIAKQVGLQLSNPKLETLKLQTGPGVLGAINAATNFVNDKLGLGPTRIYNLGINTLAQVAGEAFGAHIDRHGLTPVRNNDTLYENVARFNNAGDQNKYPTNRLVILKNKLIGTTKFDQPNVIDPYWGGPDSTYGIGTTIIHRYDVTRANYEVEDDKKNILQYKTPVNYLNTLGVSKQYFVTDKSIQLGTGIDPSNPTAPLQYPLNVTIDNPNTKKYSEIITKLNDAQNNLIISPTNNKSISTLSQQNIGNSLNFTNNDIVYKNGYGDVVKINGTWRTMNRETRIGSGRQDEINLTPLFYSSTKPGINDVYVNGKPHKVRDLIKFRIGAIDTDHPDNTTWMIFRAYLTSFQESYSAEWSDIKYIGRGEKFKLYNGFDRSVSLGFKVAALSAKEMEPMYQKLNYLASNMMPDYNNNVMRGPFMKLTVGDYLNAQQGVITSLQYTIANDTPWEISIDQPEGGSTMYDLPHIIEVSMTFIPIGVKDGELPQKKESTPVILQSDMSVGGAKDNPWLKAKVNNTYTNNPLVALEGKQK